MELEAIQKLDILEDTEDNYDFPTFYFSFANKKFYFRPLSLEVGSLNFINGANKSGKSLYLKSLIGLEKPSEIPKDKSFLKYDIVYKPQYISPKYTNTLQNFLIDYNLNENSYFDNFEKYLLNYLNEPVQSLPEDIKQILSFILFINREGLIYIFDCPPINGNIKKLFWNILKEISYQQDKIALVVDDDMEIINEIIDRDTGKLYCIRNFSDNEYFGQCE